MKPSTLLIIDFEFTMPEGKYHPQNFFPEIIEAGIVKVVDDEVAETFSSYIKPKKFPKLTRRCKSFLNITQEKVDQGMTFHSFIDKLKELDPDQNSVIITWGNMDMKVLKQNCMFNHVPFPFKGEMRDLSMEYKEFFGDKTLTNLWKAAEEYGDLGTGKQHKALDDAMTTYKLFQLVERDKQYLENPKPTTIGERIDLSKVFPHAT
ncbi:3'-5' exonuclease KapD [Bacillus sonorensis]|uniref:Sporulation inhibitor KapD n=3 Tax=Bacillaceae TaxID=186817 RepID=M5P0L5_9BACI|nr:MULTISPECIES: 3'-5' exonuclease KapD [Bacillus]TWK75640.1 DNA polymerase III PolC-type [Bacillus paralicheniformis]ASB90550.1 putative 3'-5' exonuclease KapD [Bacillus sonorensis]EME72953.1 sporulation inhibitor KapD [Bacillus sonorensis L12]MBG9913970.1 3'-5' exonuclease [Bacillus sonorensis]MCF7616805.1 3'-5' exonuclease KapD [Bacillus sonorensis]